MQTPRALFSTALLLASVPAFAQPRRYEERRDHDHYSNFYRGVREGGRDGRYYDSRHEHDGYDERFNRRHSGIGPGQGALIGGAGGAILGAILGQGLKGSLIGGAAGAGIGAIVGDASQDGRHYRERR